MPSATSTRRPISTNARRLISTVPRRSCASGWAEAGSPCARSRRRRRGFSESGQVGDLVLREVTNDLPIGEKPAGALWTSSFLPDGRSAWALGAAGAYPDSSRSLFTIEFDQRAVRSFVIATAEDYRVLVMRYPRPMPDGRTLVDWLAAAADLDAVRLTAAGLVFAQSVRVRTPHGIAQLKGWDAESTAWLNRPPGLRVTGRGGAARRPGRGDQGRPSGGMLWLRWKRFPGS